jgi:exonuclease VII small subunit
MIRVYEKGMNLNRICQNRLKSAELTIKKLEKQRLESLELDNTDAESDAG